MKCPHCGRENPDSSVYCGGCGAALGSAAPTPAMTSEPSGTTGLAIASLIFGLLGLLCLLPIVSSVVGLILGVIALRSVRGSGAQITGRRLAVAGVVTSGIGLLIQPIFMGRVFSESREMVKGTQCLSHVKQLCLGVLVYTQDYDERLPVAQRWADGLVPYLKTADLFRCPADRSVNQISYAYNAQLSAYPLSKVGSPSVTVMLFDARVGGANPSGGESEVALRHNNAAVIGFVAGQASLLARDRIASETLWTRKRATTTR